MRFMKRPNDLLFRMLVVVASVSLASLCLLVICSVVMRYVFSAAPDFVEPIALLLVIVIAMFGAATKVRAGGHIGVDSLVKKLPAKGQVVAYALQHLCLIVLVVAIFNTAGAVLHFKRLSALDLAAGYSYTRATESNGIYERG
ncbi:TRAP-type C4-dicarboxylate transport system, small permease component [Burkholderia sp. GAS332]|nr:TRAP-type C4-dicarboxylate transport system, small permease component [Burkholderia sp. GAS332]